MDCHSHRKRVRRVAFVSGVGLIFGLAFGPLIGDAIGRATGGAHGAKLVALGLKFDGAETCKGASCHSKGNDEAPPTARGSENDIWSARDPHSTAFDTLKNDQSKAMGAKLGIADVTTSKDCLGCHALDVPDNLKGRKFNVAEGNTCVSCHGPSEKWMDPHTREGWTNEQRKKYPNHAELLKNTGLYDTRPLVARAELCADCHLAIDARLVAAGHPQPKFELHYYTEYNPKTDSAWKHWTTDPGGAEIAKVWLAGQAACTRDAMAQLAARVGGGAGEDAVKAAYEQALAHGLVFAAGAKAAGVGDITAAVEAVKAAKGDPAKLAAAASAASEAAAKLFDAIEKADIGKSGKAMTAAVGAVKGIVAAAGADGHAQMFYALYALASSTADAEKAGEWTGDLFPDPAAPMSSDDFDAKLAEVVAKLPK
ncbi:MAG: multiheme c-type cytochrome [Phycisphaerales bacterium]|nr:multiheme c-type cytochrome [Phycisphaerales bacterium]